MSDLQRNKLKPIIENGTEVALNISSIVIGDSNHETNLRNFWKHFTTYAIIFGQRTFFSIIKLVFRGKLESYFFFYNTVFKDHVLFK